MGKRFLVLALLASISLSACPAFAEVDKGEENSFVVTGGTVDNGGTNGELVAGFDSAPVIDKQLFNIRRYEGSGSSLKFSKRIQFKLKGFISIGKGKRRIPFAADVSDAFIFQSSDLEGYYLAAQKNCDGTAPASCANAKYRVVLLQGTPPQGTAVEDETGSSAFLADDETPGALEGWLNDNTEYDRFYGGFRVKGKDQLKDPAGPAKLQEWTDSLIDDVKFAAFDAVFELMDRIFRSTFGLVEWVVGSALIIDVTTSQDSGIRDTWSIMRNVANVFFLLILLYIAFANVSRLNVEYYSMRALIPKFVAAVVLVNLSFFIGQIALDVANVLTASFKDLPNAIGKQPESFEDMLLGLPTLGIAVSGLGVGALLIAYIVAFLAAILIWLLAIVRILVIWLLLIVSPFAIAAMVLPATNSLSRSWWSNLFKWVFMAPVVMLVLAIGQSVVGTIGKSEEFGSDIMKGLFGALIILLAATVPVLMGGKIMGAASGFIRKAGRGAAGFGARATGLTAAYEAQKARWGLEQQRRGARITDWAGAQTGGRLGTAGGQERFDAFTRGKVEKDVSAMSSPALEQLAQQGNRWERDEALKALVAREGIDGGINRLQAASLSGRYSDPGMASAIDEFVSSNPDALDDQAVRTIIGNLENTDEFGNVTPATGLRARGYLGPPKYSSSHDYVSRMAPEDYARLGAGAIGRLPDRALQSMNLNERTMDQHLRGAHSNSILPQDIREATADFFSRRHSEIQADLSSGTITQAEANHRYVALQGEAADFAAAESGKLKTGVRGRFSPGQPPPTRGAFHRMTKEQQMKFIRHTLDKSNMADAVVPVPVPDYGSPAAPEPTPPTSPPPPVVAPINPPPRRPIITPRPNQPTINRAPAQGALGASPQLALERPRPASARPTPPPRPSRPEMQADRAEGRSRPVNIEPPAGQRRASAAPQPAPASQAQASETVAQASSPDFSAPSADMNPVAPADRNVAQTAEWNVPEAPLPPRSSPPPSSSPTPSVQPQPELAADFADAERLPPSERWQLYQNLNETGKAWAASLAPEEREAARRYKDAGFKRENARLRAGGAADPSLDAAIAKSPLAQPLVVYRGLRRSRVEEAARNGEISDAGYMSAALSRQRAAEHSTKRGESPAVLRIHVPKGTPAAWLDRVGGNDEQELLLGRGNRFKVSPAREEGGMLIADAYLVGQEETQPSEQPDGQTSAEATSE